VKPSDTSLAFFGQIDSDPAVSLQVLKERKLFHRVSLFVCDLCILLLAGFDSYDLHLRCRADRVVPLCAMMTILSVWFLFCTFVPHEHSLQQLLLLQYLILNSQNITLLFINRYLRLPCIVHFIEADTLILWRANPIRTSEKGWLRWDICQIDQYLCHHSVDRLWPFCSVLCSVIEQCTSVVNSFFIILIANVVILSVDHNHNQRLPFVFGFVECDTLNVEEPSPCRCLGNGGYAGASVKSMNFHALFRRFIVSVASHSSSFGGGRFFCPKLSTPFSSSDASSLGLQP